MTSQPRTNQQLDAIEDRAAALYEFATVADPEGQAALNQLAGTDVPALIDELRQARAEIHRLCTELAAARSQALSEVEAEIAAAIDRNRAEHPDSEPMIARRLGMRAAERVVRGLRETAVEAHAVAAVQPDVTRALTLLEAADWYTRNGRHSTRMFGHQVAAELRRRADTADPMVGSLARDGFGPDEIADMLHHPPAGR